MPSWLPASHGAQLAITAVGTGAAVACSLVALQQVLQKREQSKPTTTNPSKTPQSTLSSSPSHNEITDEDILARNRATRAMAGDYDEDLILEQLARNRVFLGDSGLSIIRNSFVIVVGVGGVGSHAAASLVRSGIGAIRLIDFDQVTLSSLNRHAVATLSDVGSSKVETVKNRLEQISPWVRFDCRSQMFSADTAEALLAPWNLPQPQSSSTSSLPIFDKPAYVVDAIDNVETKIALLRYCHKHGLPVVSSMGAGCKSDPSRVFIGDISASSEDPLSRAIRTKLRLLGVTKGIPTVFSTEKSSPNKAQLQPIPEDAFEVIKAQQLANPRKPATKDSNTDKENVDNNTQHSSSPAQPSTQDKGLSEQVAELAVLPDFRVRILPVLGTMPAIFGLTLANHILIHLAGYPSDPIRAKTREKLYDSAVNLLQSTEQTLAKKFHPEADVLGLRLAMSADDAGYLIDEIFRGKSVVSGLASRLALVRWSAPTAFTASSTSTSTSISGDDDGDDVIVSGTGTPIANPGSVISISDNGIGNTDNSIHNLLSPPTGYIDLSIPKQKVSTLQMRDVVLMTKEEVTYHLQNVLHAGVPPETVYSADVVALVHRRRREMVDNEGVR